MHLSSSLVHELLQLVFLTFTAGFRFAVGVIKLMAIFALGDVV